MGARFCMSLIVSLLVVCFSAQTTLIPPRQVLSAPTYYISVSARTCEPDQVNFNGASNLPTGAVIVLKVSAPYQDGWQDYSDDVYIPVGQDGFLEGGIHPKKGMSFHRNLILIADFTTYRPKQPQRALF